MTQNEFIRKIGALAQADAAKSGISPSLTIAQAILESSWGMSGLTVRANNLFGMKATKDWLAKGGKVYECLTKEYAPGKAAKEIKAVFKAYGSWGESVADHSLLLCKARYAAVRNETDYRKACWAVQRAGYATDPRYAERLIQLIEQHRLFVWDGAKAPPM